MNQTIKPSGVVIGLSDFCPNRCRFCYIWKRPKYPEELSAREWKDLLSSLKGWVDEPFRVSFTGGEPLAREDFVELVAFSHRLGFETYVTTSGSGLNPAKIRDLAEAGLNTITFSLESLDREKHDRLLGISGLFDTVVSAIDEIKESCPQMVVGINTIIMKDNIGDIPGLVKWVLNNPKVGFIGFQAVMQPQNSPQDPLWFKDPGFSHLWPDDIARLDSLLDELIATKARTVGGPQNKIGSSVVQLKAFKAYFRNPNHFVKEVKCSVFQKPVCINPYGGIAFCSETGDIGNIRKALLKDIWNEKIGECISKISQCKTPCAGLINCYCWDACVEEDLLRE